MAFNPLPTNLIPSWSENGTNVTFPIASVPELTAAEADAVTGIPVKSFTLCLKGFVNGILHFQQLTALPK